MSTAEMGGGRLSGPGGAVRSAPEGAPYRWRWLAFAVVLIASVMDLLDSLATNVAGPTIRADLGGGSTLIQWLGAGYTLAMAVGLITGGRLGDIYGRRRMFLIGAFGFTVASVLCSVSSAPGELIAFRVVQGLFGALLVPQGLGVIKAVFPPRELPTAFGAFGPVMGLSSVGGPVLAGWLIDADYFGTSWRMIFLINLPLGLIALAGAMAFLPRGDRATASRLDVTGAILVAGAAALLVYPVVQGRTLGWPAWAFLLMGASIAMFALFGWYETRKQRAGGEPLLIPALFRKRAFTGGLVAGLAFFTAIVGFSLILTVYLQIGLGYSPLKAGLSVLPQAAGAVIGFIAAGAGLATKLGRTLIHVGTATMAAGILGVYLILRIASIPVTPWQLAPALVVMGIGMGMVLAPFFDIVLAGVEPHETGSASGTLTALQQFGSALGVAVMGTIFFGLLAGHVTASVSQALPSLRTHLAASAVASPQQDAIIADLRACIHDRATATGAAAQPAACNQLDTAVRATGSSQVANLVDVTASGASKDGFTRTLRQALWVAAGLQLLTFALAFLLPRRARPEWTPDTHALAETGVGPFGPEPSVREAQA